MRLKVTYAIINVWTGLDTRITRHAVAIAAAIMSTSATLMYSASAGYGELCV